MQNRSGGRTASAASPPLESVPLEAYTSGPAKPNKLNGGHPSEPEAAKIPRFPRVWLDNAEFSLANDDYLKHIIPRRSNVLIYGPSGDGKTFFALDLLSHIASGQNWRGVRVRECLVVYVAAEAGASILRRAVAWRDRFAIPERESRVPFCIVTRGANLLSIGELGELMDELRAISAEIGLPVGIVAFDTLSRSMSGGDENASQDMTQIVAAADHIRDELKATTVFVHHAGKDVAKGARGHSSLFAAADTVISVIEKTATMEKARDQMSGQVYPFALEVVDLGEDQDGDSVTTCLVTPTDTPAPKQRADRPLSGVAKVALQSLQEVIETKGERLPQTSAIPANVKAVKLPDWQTQFAVRYGNDGKEDSVRRAFQRAREALLKSGSVGISNPYCWLQ